MCLSVGCFDFVCDGFQINIGAKEGLYERWNVCFYTAYVTDSPSGLRQDSQKIWWRRPCTDFFVLVPAALYELRSA